MLLLLEVFILFYFLTPPFTAENKAGCHTVYRFVKLWSPITGGAFPDVILRNGVHPVSKPYNYKADQ